MAHLFLSHSGVDRAEAEALHAWLRGLGHESVFLDVDPTNGLVAGQPWETRLYTELSRCRALVALVTPAWLESPWCAAEASHAQARGRAVFELRVPDIDPVLYARRAPPALKTPQRIVWDGSEESRGRLRDGLAAAGLDPRDLFVLPTGRPPYPGLAAFEREDAAVFFGRDTEITQLQAELRLCRAPDRPRLFILQGASGSGKSSLVRAGLLPRLERDPRSWTLVPPFRPRRNPLRFLADSLNVAASGVLPPSPPLAPPLDVASRDEWQSAWSGWIVNSASALRRHIGQVESTVLIVVDQLEEAVDGAAGDAFLRVLRDALAASGPELLALVTLRADFGGVLQRHPMLRESPGKARSWVSADLLATRTHQLSPLPPKSIAEIVTRPAALVGLDLQPALVARLTADTRTEDALPLLAYILRELWDRHGESELKVTLADYEATGGLEAAVGQRADEVLRRLSPDAATLAMFRAVLLYRMTEVLPDGRVLRRPLAWDEAPSSVRQVLYEYAAPEVRLLVAGSDAVEIAHEALFRTWARLKDWISEAREDLLLRRRAEEAADAWARSGRPRGSLWRSPDLDLLRRSTSRSPVALPLHVQDFQAQSEQQARRARWASRGVTAAILALAITAGVLGWRAENEKNLAVEQARRAVEQNARSLAERSLRLLADGSQQNSLRAARDAFGILRTVNRLHASETERAAAIQSLYHLPSIRVPAEFGRHFTLLERHAAIVVGHPRSDYMDLYAFSGVRRARIGTEGNEINGYTVDRSLGRIYTLSVAAGLVQSWDAASGSLIASFRVNILGSPTFFEFISYAGSVVYGNARSGSMLNPESGEIAELNESERAQFAPPNHQLDVDRLRAAHEAAQTPIDIGGRSVRVVADRYWYDHHSACDIAVTGEDDGLIRVWSLDDYRLIRAVPFRDRVYNIRLSPKCDLVVAAGEYGTTELFNIRSGQTIGQVEGIRSAQDLIGFDLETGRAIAFRSGSITTLMVLPPHLAPDAYAANGVVRARLAGGRLLSLRRLVDGAHVLSVHDARTLEEVARIPLSSLDVESPDRHQHVVPLAYFSDTNSILLWTSQGIFEVSGTLAPSAHQVGTIYPATARPADIFRAEELKLAPNDKALVFRTDGGWMVALRGEAIDGRHLWSRRSLELEADAPDLIGVAVDPHNSNNFLVETRSEVALFDARGARVSYWRKDSVCPERLNFLTSTAAVLQRYAPRDQPACALAARSVDLRNGDSRWEIDGFVVAISPDGAVAVAAASSSDSLSVYTTESGVRERCKISRQHLPELAFRRPGDLAWSGRGGDWFTGLEGFFSGAISSHNDNLKMFLPHNDGDLFGIHGRSVERWSIRDCRPLPGWSVPTGVGARGQVAGAVFHRGGSELLVAEPDANAVTLRTSGSGYLVKSFRLQREARYLLSDEIGSAAAIHGYDGPHRVLLLSPAALGAGNLNQADLEQYVGVVAGAYCFPRPCPEDPGPPQPRRHFLDPPRTFRDILHRIPLPDEVWQGVRAEDPVSTVAVGSWLTAIAHKDRSVLGWHVLARGEALARQQGMHALARYAAMLRGNVSVGRLLSGERAIEPIADISARVRQLVSERDMVVPAHVIEQLADIPVD